MGSLFPIEGLCGEAHVGRHRLDAFLCGLGPYQTWRDGIGVDVGSLQFRSQTAGKLPLGGFKDLVGIEVGGGSRGGDKDHASPIPFSHVGQERGGE